MAPDNQPLTASKQPPQSLLARGLNKTRAAIMTVLKRHKGVAPAQCEQLEVALLAADCGPRTTRWLLQEIELVCRKDASLSPTDALQSAITSMLEPVAKEFIPRRGLNVILLAGTNGSGKTSTAAKLCSYYRRAGHNVMLAAADTFRAAAIDQLRLLAQQCGAPVVAKAPGADPAAVCYEALQQALQEKVDLLVIDTAGRQHNNEPMLQELKKINRVLGKAAPANIAMESWIVLDATIGQNAVAQTDSFAEAATLTGLVVSKLDSSARGGMVLAVTRKLQLPVRFLGIGENLSDLTLLNPADFASNLLAS